MNIAEMSYHEDSQLTIHNGDALTELQTMAAESVQCCVTSPPYYGLRDYGVDGQIGMEETPETYITKLVDVFREVRRVLKDDGTLWVNIGDSYAGSGKGRNADGSHQEGGKQGTSRGTVEGEIFKTITPDCKPKDLIGIPWMLAFALRADGWYLRQDIIWSKPNPMPESVTDRCTKSHEYVFLLSKSASYFYDNLAVMEAAAYDGRKDMMMKGSPKLQDGKFLANGNPNSFHAKGHERWQTDSAGSYVRNRRSVWSVPTKPYSEAHFATFPPALIEPCILAGSRPGDTVLDPFGGSGTTAQVANKFGRKAALIELNPKYCELAMKRNCQKTLFAGAEV